MRVERSNVATDDDKAVVSMMALIKLERGEMLLLGPRSVKILTRGKFAGVLPDKYIFSKKEWNR